MLDVMDETRSKVDMLGMITEHKLKRVLARDLAISALEGYIAGDVSQAEYDHAVAEYSDVLVDIHMTEYNHLNYTGEDDDSTQNKEL